MLDINEIEDRLWNLTVDDIDKKCLELGIGRTGIKQDKINKILKVYKEENWAINNYNNLNVYEKELVTNLIKYNFYPTYESTRKIIDKYKSTGLPTIKYNHFFIKDDVPNTIKSALMKIAPPQEINFEKIEEMINPEEYYAYIIGRENRITDFDELIKFIVPNKVKLTTSNKYFPKKDLIKYHDITNYMDVIRNGGLSFNDIKNVTDTTVSFGIINLLEVSGVISLNHEYIEKSYNYKDFVKKNKIEKFKNILESYISSSSVFINETKRIQRAKLNLISYPELKEPRHFILNMLKLLPLDNSWIRGSDFREVIRMKDYNFLRKYTGYIEAKDEFNWYSNYYDEATFEQVEYGFIDVCLIEYFATIGIIDVIIDYREEEYTGNNYLEVRYLRFTNLGAILLGLKEDSGHQETDNRFIINDNYQIIIPNGKNRLEYELYFERFLTKVDNAEENTIYSIDFIGIAKANDLGIDLSEIITYMQEKSSNCSSKVIEKIEKWRENIGKIKIKTVEIIEYPKELEETLKSNVKINKLLKNSTNIISVINKKDIDILKKNIEKLELFCEIENINKDRK